MNLNCLNDIISNDLIVNIDINNIKSWNLNTGLTVNTISKWANAVSDNIDLIDYGLTAFDVGRTNAMWNGIVLTPEDNIFTMYRIGYNDIINPTVNETSGMTIITNYLPITVISTGTTGNYFDLNGGYLQGFFKLHDYNYELLPTRYNHGITIETMLYLKPESYGIFYMMGARAEDKYNPYFNGELITGNTENTGITTSYDNYLDSFTETLKYKNSFILPEDSQEIHYNEENNVNVLKNNVISFEITGDKKLKYKYINNNGLIISDESKYIITSTGLTLISISFLPYNVFNSILDLQCAEQRTGKLIFYINGRAIWIIDDFPEFYFKSFTNNKEKQIGVPYSISWGGGSFGLRESWHYDYQTYNIYTGQDINYINEKFVIETTGGTTISGLSLNVVENNMMVTYTGGSENQYFIKFNQPISVLSNRDYVINLSIYNDNFFSVGARKISLYMYSDTVDINIIKDIEYINGSNTWTEINSIFRITDNTGQNDIYIGILIEADSYNINGNLYINDYTYTGADILVQDERKFNQLIEQNFDLPFIGGIQKLRIYNKCLTSPEILHNAIIESKTNPNIIINKGGRLIYK